MKEKIGLAAILAVASGCMDKDEPPAPLPPPTYPPPISASFDPESPLAGVPFALLSQNIHYLDQDTSVDSDGDGNPANDGDFLANPSGTTSIVYAQPGRFIARAVNRDTGQALDLEVYVRESDAFDTMLDQLDGSKLVTPINWDRHVEPYLMPETASNLKNLKELLALDGLVISNYHVNESGAWVEIRRTLPGLTDSNEDGNVEYFGRFALQKESFWQALTPLEDIIGQAYTIQPPVKAWMTIEQEKPDSAEMKLDSEIPLSLPGQSPWGNVLNEYVFRYLINGRQVVTGINYMELPRPSDQPIVDTFEALTTGATPQVYDPRGILVIPQGTKAEIREKIAQRKTYDKANN